LPSRALAEPGQDLLVGTSDTTEDGDILYESPAFLTSETGKAQRATTTTAATGNADVSWLSGLTHPDFPVRWDDRVVKMLEFYKNDPGGRKRMKAWLKRANVYRGMVQQTLRAESLPEDLVYVAMVESGFDPTVTSHAGAVGLWQFVERTGSDYGLKVTKFIDTRRDPEAATRAAAKFLRSLKNRLGSWELALAAYNMGLTGLERAMKKYNTNDYWMLTRFEAGLPFETTQYVAKIMACAVVGRNLERFGYANLELDAPLAFETVEVPPGSSVSLVARAAGTDAKTIHALNPAIRKEKTNPEAKMTIRIPVGSKTNFPRAWARLRQNETEHQPHVVKFGETIQRIAKMYRTTPSVIVELNELPEDGALSAGLRLMVPAGSPVALKDDDAELPVAAVPPGTFVYSGRRRVFYEATDVDTVERIAEFFRVPASDVRLWNHLAEGRALTRGLMLQLFVKPEVDLTQALVLNENEVTVLTVGSKEFFDYHEAQRDRVRIRYTVREKDTLEGLAKRFDLSVGSLGRINAFGRGRDLKAGEDIIIYCPKDRLPKDAEVLTADPIDQDALDAESPAPGPKAAGPKTPGASTAAPSPKAGASEVDASGDSGDAPGVAETL
jgi:membrane-bound lytic murein transglycosylase D